MDTNLEQLYDRLMSNVYSVLEVFTNYYGEERVDLQGFLPKELFLEQGSLDSDDAYNSTIIHDSGVILVHFPQVTVTNENDKSIDITQLWVKVGIRLDGTITGRFKMNRSEYTISQILADYSHSHLSGIPFEDSSRFEQPCTGTGPINNTIAGLAAQCDLDFWGLFCYELDLYTKTESLAGTPYKYLERVGQNANEEKQGEYTILKDITFTTNTARGFNTLSLVYKSMIKDFLDYFIQKKPLKFIYDGGDYSIGMSFLEFRILLSNHFIQWYNRADNPYRHNSTCSFDRLIHNNILCRCSVEGPRVYRYRRRDRANYGRWSTKEALMANFNNKLVCRFKGQEIRTNIIDDEGETSSNSSYLFDQSLTGYILYLILRTVNYKIAKYGIANSKYCSADIATCRKLRYI